MSIRTREIIGKAILETLEGRQMMSAVTLTDGVLVVAGNSNAANHMSVHANGKQIWAVTDDGSSEKFAESKVRQIRIYGGDKNDTVSVEAAVHIPVFVKTGNGNDTIVTGSGNDRISAGNGDDNIDSGAGKDWVDGGNGNDTIVGGSGNDRIDGGNGSDVISDGRGRDIVNAGSGDDTVHSGLGADRIMLGAGKDLADGIEKNDAVTSNSHDVVDDAGPKVGSNRGSTGDSIDDGGSDGDSSGGDDSSGGGDSSGGSTDPTTTVVPSVSSFTLINADTNQSILGYTNVKGAMSIDLTTLPTTHLNIKVNFDSSFTGSVVFGYDSNAAYSTENLAPYAFDTDNNGNYYAWTPTVGTHTISATTYSGKGATGTAGAMLSLTLNVSQSSTTPVDPTPVPDPTPQPTPDPTPGSDAPDGVITVMENSIDVDHAVQVNGLSSNLKSGTVLNAKFQWDFGDPGSAFNQLVGWNAAHLYQTPGTYTISLTITNQDGKTSVTTQTVNVAASNRKVIYVSNDGSDTASGLSPQSAVKSFAHAMSMVGNNTEVLFNSGDTFDVPTGGATINSTNVVLGSYGSGAKPILMYTGTKNYSAFISTGSAAKDVTIENLTFDSIYNKDQEKTGMPDAMDVGGTNVTAFQCTFLNVGYGMNTNRKPTGVLMQSCDAPDPEGLRSYLAYCQGSDQVYIGNTVANSTREHCIRVDGTDRILIAYNNFTNLDNPTGKDPTDISKQTITVHHGSYAYVYGNVCNDGRVEIGPLGEGDGLKPTNINDRLNYVRIEDNTFNFTDESRLEIDHGTNHVMIDDNTIHVKNGAGIAIQAEGMYTDWPQYGTRLVDDATVAGDNTIIGADIKIAVGKGSENIDIMPAGSPIWSPEYVLQDAA